MSAFVKIRIDTLRLSEYDANGYLGFQYDAFGEQQSGIPAVEAMSPYGFIGRPLDPEVDAGGAPVFAAQLFLVTEGAEQQAMPLHDPRLVPGLPELQKGEALFYGPKFNFVRCHADGRVAVMCTTDGTANGSSVQAEQAPDGWTWSAPWAVARNNASGWYYRHADGARLEGGSIGGLPAPLSELSSYWLLEAAIVSIRGTAVKVGVGTFMPAAKATPTVAADAALLTALQAVQGALTALGNIGVNGAAAGAIAASLAAVQSAAATVGATALTIPAASVQVA